MRAVKSRRSLPRRIAQCWQLYLLILPAVAAVTIFHYVPIYGLQIAFRNYRPSKGIWGSDWVGMKWFLQFFNYRDFWPIIRNTLSISLYTLATFPCAVLLALMINEVRSNIAKKTLQTVMYLPHFISWVVVGALFMNIMGTTGIVNQVIMSLGGEPQKFFMDNRWFRFLLVITSAWKETGWNTIVYLAAIAGIDPELYEAAKIDRANRFQQILHVTLPGIASTVIMMLILRLGGIMDAGFSQILVMYNSTVYKSGDIIGTYIFREGIGKLNWSQGTIVGMFNSVINMLLLLGGNWLSRRLTERSIW